MGSNIITSIFIVLGAIGIITVLIGIFIRKYPKEGRFLNLKYLSIETIASKKYIRKFLNFLAGKKNGILYKMSEKLLIKSEVGISMQTLYLLKIVSLITVVLVFLLVKYTNIDILKTTTIAKSAESINLFENTSGHSYSYNFTLYTAVLKNIGENTMARLNDDQKFEAVKNALKKLMESKDNDVIEAKANTIVKTYNALNGIRLIDWTLAVVIMFALYLPEIILFLRMLLLSSMYRKEVVKLENIFELLGNIQEKEGRHSFKTINILEEMAKSSKVYRRHLLVCKDIYKSDKRLALDTLKLQVGSSKFSRLVDVLRIYALNDKKLAMEILERNKTEKEEELLLTAEENVDVVDVLAFLSIVPVLWELANLFMKPMLDMINEAFKYV